MEYVKWSDKDSTKSKFEERVFRWGGYQSHELKLLTGQVRLYLINQGEKDAYYYVKLLEEFFDGWREKNPREFHERLGNDAQKFLNDLKELEIKHKVKPPVSHIPPAAVENRHRSRFIQAELDRYKKAKTAAKLTESAASKGISAAQMGTHSQGVMGLTYAASMGKGAAAAATLAASATGIGLIAGAAAASVIESGLAIKSAYSTHQHLVALKYLRDHLVLYKAYCAEILPAKSAHLVPAVTKFSMCSHEIVATTVLDYIINQKEWKYGKKISSSVPVVGALPVILMSASSKVYKFFGGGGGMGVERHRNAHWLASHLCSCECELAGKIVSALYGEDEMHTMLRECDYETMAGLLAEKMKSN